MRYEASRRRGLDKERDLARKLWGMGFASMRAPASGARAKHIVQPDVIAAIDGAIFAFEVKVRSELPLYIEREQVEKLSEWARRAGARAFVAVYYSRAWRLVPLEAVSCAERTCRVGEEELSRALKLEDLRGLKASSR